MKKKYQFSYIIITISLLFIFILINYCHDGNAIPPYVYNIKNITITTSTVTSNK